jgi:flagellar protein FlgJ
VQTFVEKVRPHAEAVAKAMGVPAEYLIAQAGLETGWGRSLPKSANGTSSYNLFGIKAGASWNGAVAQAQTTEYTNGQAVQASGRFRSYGSFGEAFQDFARLLRTSPRYSGVLAHANDPKAYAASLQRAGYATDPQYGAKLARAIQTVARHAAPAVPDTLRAAGPPAATGLDTVQVAAAGVDNNVVAG